MKKNRRISFLPLFLFLPVFLFSIFSACEKTQGLIPSSETFRTLGLEPFEEYMPIPDITLTGFEGDTQPISQEFGSVLLLNFWATWCPPCRAEIPSMEKLADELKGKDFKIVAINLKEPSALVKSFIKEFDITFPVYLDPEAEAAQSIGVMHLPTSLLIDRQGRAVAFANSAIEWDNEDLVAALSRWTR